MGTRSFFVIANGEHNGDEESDAVITSKDKRVLGNGYYQESPQGNKFLVCKLKKDYWIMTDEEYKQLHTKK